jgi:uncharacterized protein YkwD
VKKKILIIFAVFSLLLATGCKKTSNKKIIREVVSSEIEIVTLEPEKCPHENTTIINKIEPTCTEGGYSGDAYCNDCKTTISKGTVLQPTRHPKTEVRNKKAATSSEEGYTGDVYCTICGAKLSSGKSVPKTQKGTSSNNLFNNATLSGMEAFDKALSAANKTAKSDYPELETQIFDLVNAERTKAGLPALLSYEKAYYYMHLRAQEAGQPDGFSHTRPNGKHWDTVFSDANVDPNVVTHGENLGGIGGHELSEIPALIVDGWMDSPAHKANILDKDYKYMVIAVVKTGDAYYIAQGFFG